MRIFSKFRDYYDCVQRHGQDRSIVYVRDSIEEFFNRGWAEDKNRRAEKYPFPTLDHGERWFFSQDFDRTITFRANIVGFCGQIFPAVRLHKDIGWTTLSVESRQGLSPDDKTVFCFNIQQIDDFVATNTSSSRYTAYSGAKKKHKKDRAWRETLVLFFAECEKVKNDFRRFFDEKTVPIFVANAERFSIEFNAKLNDVEFYRVFDPFAAFQEIARFMGNFAEARKVAPPISDEMRAQAHGFDKWSFRTPPYPVK